MSETAAHIALVQTASAEGVEIRRRHLSEHGRHELGWSYANIQTVERRLRRQLAARGFFRVYLFIPEDDGGSVRYRMRITALRTYAAPRLFVDPVDRHRYLVHSRMTIDTVDEMPEPLPLEWFRSVDERHPDIRHLQLGFLFVVDPEI